DALLILISPTSCTSARRQIRRLIFAPSRVSNPIANGVDWGTYTSDVISPPAVVRVDPGFRSWNVTGLSSSAVNATVRLWLARVARARLPPHAEWSSSPSSRASTNPSSHDSRPASSQPRVSHVSVVLVGSVADRSKDSHTSASFHTDA